MMKLSERMRKKGGKYAPDALKYVPVSQPTLNVWANEVAQLEAENARLVKVASRTDECNTWAFIDEPCDCHMGLIAQLEAELLDIKVREEAYYYKCQKLEAENERLKRVLKEIYEGPHHSAIDATKCSDLVEWTYRVIDSAGDALKEGE